MSENKPLAFNDIINLLDTANKTLETKIKLASVPDKIVVSPMNAMHSKNILKSAATGMFADQHFTLVTYHIFKEIVKFPLESLTLADRNLLLLHLRSRNISDDIEVELEGKKMVDGKEVVDKIKRTLKLSWMLGVCSFDKTEFEDQVVDCDEYSVVLKFPSIKDDYDFTEHLLKHKLSSVNEDDRNAVRGLIAPVFVYSIAQYIKQLNIGDKQVSVSNKKLEERLAIAEKLSAKATNKIIKTIDGVFNKTLLKTTEVKMTVDEVEYTGHLELSAGLFIA